MGVTAGTVDRARFADLLRRGLRNVIDVLFEQQAVAEVTLDFVELLDQVRFSLSLRSASRSETAR